MAKQSSVNWQVLTGLVLELKRCDEFGLITASVAMAFICIDTMANLCRPVKKKRATRADFIEWVDTYLKCHSDQPYLYRGKDVYAARCAFLHTYGTKANLHETSDVKMFGYHNGGRHSYNPNIDESLVLIGTRSFVNDVIIAVTKFLKKCDDDPSLYQRIEERLPQVMQTIPIQLR